MDCCNSGTIMDLPWDYKAQPTTNNKNNNNGTTRALDLGGETPRELEDDEDEDSTLELEETFRSKLNDRYMHDLQEEDNDDDKENEDDDDTPSLNEEIKDDEL